MGQVLTTAVIIVVAAVNIAGAKSIDQSVIVVILLAVFAVFIVVTLAQMNPDLLAPSTYPRNGAIMSSVALTFFAYLGFTVISFTGGDLPNPAKNLPGDVPRPRHHHRALHPDLPGSLRHADRGRGHRQRRHGTGAGGQAGARSGGFRHDGRAALLATSSSVNANIYAATGSTAKLAESRMFPPVFGERAYVGGTRGLTISVLLVLLLATSSTSPPSPLWAASSPSRSSWSCPWQRSS